MKIHIRKIRAEGVEINESFSQEWSGLTSDDGICFIEPIRIQAMITRAGDEIFVKIAAKSRYESFCYRCLNNLEKDWSFSYTLIFDIDKQKEFIEIGDDIRQELILNLPERILCRDNCQGLCVDCGVDLNSETCICAEKKVKGQKVKVNL